MKRLISIFTLSLLLSASALAAKGTPGVETPIGLTLGAQVGTGAPLAPGSMVQFAFGGDLLYYFIPRIGLGLEYSGGISGSLLNTNSVNSFLTVSRFVLVKGFYFTPAVGFSLFTVSNYLANTTAVELALGARSGYDFRVSRHFGIGPEVAYLFGCGPAIQPVHLLYGLIKIRYSF
ncbi:MAG: hypothetical protein ACXWPM_02385 [Bdellovibrionota bacterium]